MLFRFGTSRPAPLSPVPLAVSIPNAPPPRQSADRKWNPPDYYSVLFFPPACVSDLDMRQSVFFGSRGLGGSAEFPVTDTAIPKNPTSCPLRFYFL